MNHHKITARLSSLLHALHFDTSDYAAVAYAYILARLNLKYDVTNKHLDCRALDALNEELVKYHLDPCKLRQDDLPVLAQLSELLATTEMDSDYRKFFDLLTPYIVFDWDRITGLLEGKGTDIWLCILYFILLRTTVYPFGKTAFTQPTLLQLYNLDTAVYKHLGLDFTDYLQCWYAVHFLPLPASKCHPSKKITKTIGQYDKMSIPRQQLLSDLESILNVKEESGVAPSPWKTSGIMKSNEGGLTADEHLFCTSASNLTSESIGDVVQAAFYEKRDDFAIECGLILDEFLKMLLPGAYVSIVNPSPNFLAHWADRCPTDIHVTFLVGDGTLAYLYSRSYPKFSFCPLDDMQIIKYKFDYMLILARDLALDVIYPVLQLISPTGKLLALLPETAITLPSCSIIAHLDDFKMSAMRMMSIPTGITQSSPRKKILLWADHLQHNTFQLFNSAVHTGNLFVQKQYTPIPYSWLYGSMTAQQLRDAYAKTITTPNIRHPNEQIGRAHV